DVSYYQVQTAEKDVQRFRLRARGTPGHASLPYENSAIVKLAEKLTRLRDARLPVHLSETARAYITGLAAGQAEPLRSRFLDILNPDRCDDAIASLDLPASLKRQLHANIR